MQQKRHIIQPLAMLDLLFSLITFAYFVFNKSNADSCFYLALILNIIHISCFLLILIPIVTKVCRKGSMKGLYKDYIKATVVSKYRMPIFCCVLSLVSLFGLYGLLVNLFKWTNFGYLFAIFCVIGASMTEVATYASTRLDCSIYFSLQVYKYFCLAVTSILFGISASEMKLSAQILGIGWIYFVYRSKQSLPKEVMYYLIMFLDIIILITAISVIASSQSITPEQDKIKHRFRFMFALLFYGVLFIKEMYQFVQLYKRLGTTSQFGMSKDQNQVTKFYLMMENLKNNERKQQRSQDCSICLQQMYGQQNSNKGEQLVLRCGHHFHFECLEQWAYINHTCPMCRSSMLQPRQQINL